MKYPMLGSFAPTAAELVETSKYLDDLIERWPNARKTKEQQAVERFSDKLRRLVMAHEL